MKRIFASKTLTLAQDGSKPGLYPSDLAPSENVHKFSEPFCPNDDLNSIDICFFLFVFT